MFFWMPSCLTEADAGVPPKSNLKAVFLSSINIRGSPHSCGKAIDKWTAEGFGPSTPPTGIKGDGRRAVEDNKCLQSLQPLSKSSKPAGSIDTQD